MCDKPHRYTVEVIGQKVRYAGTDQDEAISALLTVNPDCGEEGQIIAEHDLGTSTSYCHAESDRLESEAIKLGADMEQKYLDAYDAFHGDGPYALANQDW